MVPGCHMVHGSPILPGFRNRHRKLFTLEDLYYYFILFVFFPLSLSIDGFISEPGASPQVSTIPQIAVSLALQPKLSQVPSVVRRRRANGENLMASALGGLRYL